MSPNGDDENLPESEGNALPSEAGREASPLSHVTAVSIRWKAPLPPPALLEQYDQVVPGLAQEIAEEARAEASHLREHEDRALKASIRYHAHGQWMALAVVMAIVGLAALALWVDAKWVAGIAVSIVAGLAARFILGTHWQRKEKGQGD